MRIVLDTVCFVTAVRSSAGASGWILGKILGQELVALMDLKLSLEYWEVALRREHLSCSALTAEEVLLLIDAIESVAEPVEVLAGTRPLSVDPDDDMVLDLAISGNADALVTYNTQHFLSVAAKYGFQVLTPAELIQVLKKEEGHNVK